MRGLFSVDTLAAGFGHDAYGFDDHFGDPPNVDWSQPLGVPPGLGGGSGGSRAARAVDQARGLSNLVGFGETSASPAYSRTLALQPWAPWGSIQELEATVNEAGDAIDSAAERGERLVAQAAWVAMNFMGTVIGCLTSSGCNTPFDRKDSNASDGNNDKGGDYDALSGDGVLLKPVPGVPGASKPSESRPVRADTHSDLKFTPQMKSQAEVIARGSKIHKVGELVEKFGGKTAGWRKMKTWDKLGREIHLYEHPGIGVVGAKLAGTPDPF